MLLEAYTWKLTACDDIHTSFVALKFPPSSSRRSLASCRSANYEPVWQDGISPQTHLSENPYINKR